MTCFYQALLVLVSVPWGRGRDPARRGVRHLPGDRVPLPWRATAAGPGNGGTAERADLDGPAWRFDDGIQRHGR
ncbi:hypothetical protein CA850_29040 [Micromonospora echinospora]|nr:hypothetical protein CA850_29040 [Micromonospora echinospora]